MQSTDSPVRPFWAEPAEPAFAVPGAPPDAPTAAPARVLLSLTALALLWTPAPVAAARCVGKCKERHALCPPIRIETVEAISPRKSTTPTTVTIRASGGAFLQWPRIDAELMP